MKSIPTNWLVSNRPSRNCHRPTARATERGRVVFESRHEPGTRRGFTLTEILVALALIIIIGSLSAVDMSNIASSINHLPPAKVLESSIREARYLAMSRMDNVVLTYNGDNHSFDLLDSQGNVLEQDPDGNDNPDANLTVTFTPILAMNDLVTDPGTQSDDESQLSKVPSPRLVFHATGATEPVKVTLSLNGNDTKFDLDPFSEGPPPKFPETVPPLPSDTN